MRFFRKGASGLSFPRGRRESIELLALVALLFLAVGMWIGIWISGGDFYNPGYRVAIPIEMWAVHIIGGVLGFLGFVALKAVYVFGVTRGPRGRLLFVFLFLCWIALSFFYSYREDPKSMDVFMQGIAGASITILTTFMGAVFLWYWANVPVWMVLYFEVLLWPLMAGVLGPDNPGIAMGFHGGAAIVFGMWYAPDRISLKRFLQPSKGVL